MRTVVTEAALDLTLGLLRHSPTMQRVRLTRSVGGLSCVPYLAGVTCSVLWLKYGLMNADSTIVSVNAVGACLNAYYLGVFYAFTGDRVRAHGCAQCLVALAL